MEKKYFIIAHLLLTIQYSIKVFNKKNNKKYCNLAV